MASQSDELDLGPVPLLSGPPSLVDGYYELERLERDNGMDTLARHRYEFSLWYRLLFLHSQVLGRGFNFRGHKEDELQALHARMDLLGLGLTSSKAALDLLIVGYYSIAYAAIRHMVESWVECRYIEMKPDQAKRFYKTRSGAPPPKGKTPFKNKIDELKACFPEDADIFDQAYVEWTRMSNGSHPSGIGIAQNNLPGEAEKVLGATYRPDMFQDGITGGITAAAFLVHEAGRLSPQGDGWVADLADVMMQAVNLLKPAP